MKRIFFLVALLISVTAYSQDAAYNATVKFDMPDSTENGITFQRKAFFEAMVYNQRINNISLQYRIEFYNTNGSKKMGLVRPYGKEISVSKSTYVVTATGNYVGDINAVLALYGKPVLDDSTRQWETLPDGRFDLTTPCVSEYDYVVKGFDDTKKLHAIIKQIGQREASAGRLQ